MLATALLPFRPSRLATLTAGMSKYWPIAQTPRERALNECYPVEFLFPRFIRQGEHNTMFTLFEAF
jgi:hypothetical protein